MFEHLDDPEGPPAHEHVRTAVMGRVRRRRRRRVAVAGGVTAVAVLGAGAVVAVRERVTPETVDVAGLAEDAGPVDVEGADEVDPGAPRTYLLVGTDAVDADDEPAHTDTIVLARVDPTVDEVRLLPVPRDLLVMGDGEAVRINSLLATGGPDALVRAISDELGVPVHHYVEVDLAGAVDLVDAVGGIRVATDSPLRDDRTGLRLDAGCHVLDGDATVALGRSRQLQRRTEGTWQLDPTADIGRQRRSTVVAAALLQAIGRVRLPDLPALIEAGLGSVLVDDGLDTDDLVALTRQASGARLLALTLPVDDAAGPNGSEVLVLGPAAPDSVTALLDPAPSPPVSEELMLDPVDLRPC